MHLTAFLLATLATLSSVLAKSTRQNSIFLSTVKTLTLRDGQQTTHRRVSALPQLACVGGNAKGLYSIDTLQCTNMGSSYGSEDIEWSCRASLPPEFKLGSTDVICEGYEGPDDPYVLKGSCGVEYRLMLTDVGEEKYGRSSFERAYRNPSKENAGTALFNFIFWLVFVGVIGIFIYRLCIAPAANGPAGNNRYLGWNGGGGGGGGPDDNDDHPPPPYTPRAPKPKPSYPGGSTHGQNANGTWRPGFWSGTAAGAAAAYAANAFNNRSQTRAPPGRDRVYEYDPPQAGAGPSNWFGRTRDPEPPRYGGGGGGGFSAPSSSRHESTGFGGTRRR